MEVIVVLVLLVLACGGIWLSTEIHNARMNHEMQRAAEAEKLARQARAREKTNQLAIAKEQAEIDERESVAQQERGLRFRDAVDNTEITWWSVSDGKGIDRKRVIVEATCRADTALKSRLHLYRSRNLYKSPQAVMAADDAQELTYVELDTSGELRFVDPKVISNEVYYYYIWISSIFIEAFAINGRENTIHYRFGHCAHTVTYTETIGDLAERKKAVHQARETLDSMKPKPPPKPEPTLAEKTAEAIQKIVAQQRSVKEAADVLAAELPKYGNLTAKEQQIISAKINQFIQNEFKKSTG